MLNFRVNREKTISALLFLMRTAAEHAYRPTQYDLVKSLFLADRAHLNRYGRPITFDRYYALLHGPVPQFAYNTLKPSFVWPSLGRTSAPWSAAYDGAVKARRYAAGAEIGDFRDLSKSDQKELRNALNIATSLSFGQLRKLTHEDAAYLDAWKPETGKNSFEMNVELLLDDADEDAIDDLRNLAEMMA